MKFNIQSKFVCIDNLRYLNYMFLAYHINQMNLLRCLFCCMDSQIKAKNNLWNILFHLSLLFSSSFILFDLLSLLRNLYIKVIIFFKLKQFNLSGSMLFVIIISYLKFHLIFIICNFDSFRDLIVIIHIIFIFNFNYF